MVRRLGRILVALAAALMIAFPATAFSATVDAYETIYSNENIQTVYNEPTQPTVFTPDRDYLIQSVTTYHWNDGKGEEPGFILIVRVSDYSVVGAWNAEGRTGYRGVPNAYWDIFPNVVLEGGVEYAVMPSGYETWSHNPESSDAGFVNIRGIPYAASEAPPDPAVREDASPAAEAARTAAKQIEGDGDILLGTLSSDGFSMELPQGAYEGARDSILVVKPAADVPEMPHAVMSGRALEVKTGAPRRLEEAATLTYRYDPGQVSDPLLLCLGYYDGAQWSYLQAESLDESACTVTFRIHHFSTYYPSRFKSELEAAKHYAEQFAARTVLGEEGGDSRIASQTVADYMAGKLGLGDSELARRMMADIAGDQDIIKVVDEFQKDGMSATAYEKVAGAICGKIANYLIENRSGLTEEDGVILTYGERGLKKIGDLIKATDSGSKLLGSLSAGDMQAVKSELFNIATDNTGAYGKALKYTLQGMQHTIDVWRDGEVEKAYQVYTEGSAGSLFGYGEIAPGDFEGVWDSMRGSARQLCLERIRLEEEARAECGMPPLTDREAELFREKVKQELKSEFERRAALQSAIDAEEENLNLIFEELDKADMLDASKVWYRGFGGKYETLENRMARMEHLIQRIYRDLGIERVYPGAQMSDRLDGSISAMAMSELVRRYFAADTQAEAESTLQDEYVRLFPEYNSSDDAQDEAPDDDAQPDSGSAVDHASIAGEYRAYVTGTSIESDIEYIIENAAAYENSVGDGPYIMKITPSGNGGIIDMGMGTAYEYAYADGKLTCSQDQYGVEIHVEIAFERTGAGITGNAAMSVAYTYDGTLYYTQRVSFSMSKVE